MAKIVHRISNRLHNRKSPGALRGGENPPAAPVPPHSKTPGRTIRQWPVAERPREVLIDLRLADLQAHHVDVRDVAEAIRANHVDRTIGILRTGQRNLMLRADGIFKNLSTAAKTAR